MQKSVVTAGFECNEGKKMGRLNGMLKKTSLFAMFRLCHCQIICLLRGSLAVTASSGTIQCFCESRQRFY